MLNTIKSTIGHKAIPHITLTPLEAQICTLLDQVTREHYQKHQKMIQLRIAGGWVRDKLLGKDSHDLDFAVNTMTGYNFACLVNDYLAQHGHEVRRVGKISINPERSKHLETATTVILKTTVDFVNLRSEQYTAGSRIPQMVPSFGTPTEDAFRRDCTINALFYNIHQHQVEDFTDMGLRDLTLGIIRTPLPPLETFLDDPLRILRIVRFSTRFGFTVVEEIKQALKSPEVHVVNLLLIARMRLVLKSAENVLTRIGPDPVGALEMLSEAGLMPLIFGSAADNNYNNNITVARELSRAAKEGEIKEEWRFPLFLAAAMLHTKGQTITRKNKIIPLATEQIRESLKLSNSDADCAASLLFHIDEMCQLLYKSEFDRVTLGLVIRKMAALPGVGDDWETVMAFTAAVEPQIKDKYLEFMHMSQQFSLLEVHKLKPIIDGRDAAKVLKVKGAQIGQVLEQVIKWQLANPDGTREECLHFLNNHSVIR